MVILDEMQVENIPGLISYDHLLMSETNLLSQKLLKSYTGDPGRFFSLSMVPPGRRFFGFIHEHLSVTWTFVFSPWLDPSGLSRPV